MSILSSFPLTHTPYTQPPEFPLSLYIPPSSFSLLCTRPLFFLSTINTIHPPTHLGRHGQPHRLLLVVEGGVVATHEDIAQNPERPGRTRNIQAHKGKEAKGAISNLVVVGGQGVGLPFLLGAGGRVGGWVDEVASRASWERGSGRVGKGGGERGNGWVGGSSYPSMTKSMSGLSASQSMRYSPLRNRVAPTCLARAATSFFGPVMREVPVGRR